MTNVINWAEALAEVGDDETFLFEVLGDLLTEAAKAKDDMKNAIADKNFETINHSAHQVKGSASYLRCEALRAVSERLQDIGRQGKDHPDDQLWEEVERFYKKYCDSLDDLQEAADKRKKK
jgi:HPt (histidine-containing phosphotransfer) domain-containing protein